MDKKINKLYIGIILVIITLFSTLIFMHSPISKMIPVEDSSGYLYDGYALLNGVNMYSGFFDHKGPLMYTINAFGQIFGNYTFLWFIETILIFIFYLFIYKTLKIITDKKMPIVLTLLLVSYATPFFFNMGNQVETFSLPFIGISLYYFIRYFYNRDLTNIQAFIIGLSFMAVMLLRINNATLWLVFCPVIFFNLIYKKRVKDAFKILLYFFLGALVMFLPFIIYFTINNIWKDFIYDYITFNLMYMSVNHNSTLLSTLNSVISYPLTVAVIVSIIVNFKRIKKILYFSLVSYTVITYIIIISPFNNYPHYGALLFPCYFIWCIYLLFILIDKIRNKKYLYILPIVLLFLGLFLKKDNGIFYYYTYSDVFNYPRIEIINVANVVDSYTSEEDKILVTQFMPEVYLASNRLSSSKYFYTNLKNFSKIDSIMNEYYTDIVKEDTKMFIISDQVDLMDYPLVYDKIHELVNEYYTYVGEINGFLVYVKKDYIDLASSI